MSTSPIYLYDGDGLCYCDNKIGVVFNLYTNFKRMKAAVPMVKYYCDMCEKEVFIKEHLYKLTLSKNDNIYNSISKDICRECYEKIKNMVKRKSKN